jgi:hypothetical protein
MGLVWVLARLLELDDREPEAPAGGERPVTESVEVVSQEAPS